MYVRLYLLKYIQNNVEYTKYKNNKFLYFLMNYSKSTQRKFWLLTPEQITEARNEVHEKARIVEQCLMLKGILIIVFLG